MSFQDFQWNEMILSASLLQIHNHFSHCWNVTGTGWNQFIEVIFGKNILKVISPHKLHSHKHIMICRLTGRRRWQQADFCDPLVESSSVCNQSSGYLFIGYLTRLAVILCMGQRCPFVEFNLKDKLLASKSFSLFRFRSFNPYCSQTWKLWLWECAGQIVSFP